MLPKCSNFDVVTTIFYIETELEYTQISESRLNYIADMLHVTASKEKTLSKKAKSWGEQLEKINRVVEKRNNKVDLSQYSKEAFVKRLYKNKAP